MNKKTAFLFFLLFHLFVHFGIAQHKTTTPYLFPDDEKVIQTIKEWQELKFGLFIHWGTYSQWGIIESWSICPEDKTWISRPKDKSYFEYKNEYENLKTSFNPVKFAPEKWSAAARNAGMKYVVFTTKHHDGFSMFDTRLSDYRVTSPGCPFHAHPKANIAKEIFNSFRNDGFMIGAYYSTSDWNHKDYWWDYFPPTDRQVNYSPEKYPEKWEGYNSFMYHQLEELATSYGNIDLFWFDLNEISREKKVDWQKIAAMLRNHQPGTMMVVRASNGLYENYRTPEQEVPEEALDYPWETCMTMGNQWSYRKNDNYKPAHQLIQTLVQVVSRGGNFLLNVGPDANGELDPVAYSRLEEIGNWMKINGEAIYGTQTAKPYHETKLAFTRKDNIVYAIYLPNKDENTMPSKVAISSFQPLPKSQIFMLGHVSPLKWETNGKGIIVNIPKTLQNNPVCKNAWTFKLQVK